MTFGDNVVGGTVDGLVKKLIVDMFIRFDDGGFAVFGDYLNFFGLFAVVIYFYVNSFHGISLSLFNIGYQVPYQCLYQPLAD